jgi:tetratricopeptide (TPR) repeat protein
MGTNNPATWFTSAVARVKSFFTKASSGDCFRRGRRHFEKGEHAKAIAGFTAAIRLDPKNASKYHWRAWCYCEKGDFEKAIADFTEALRLESTVVDQVIADLTETIRLDPNDADAYYNRGACYLLKGEPDNAIADFTEAIRLGHPRAALACNYRGVCHFGKGHARMVNGEYDAAVTDFLNAVDDFTEAIRLDPNMAVSYYNRGRCRINLANHYSRPAQTGEHDQASTDILVDMDFATPARPRARSRSRRWQSPAQRRWSSGKRRDRFRRSDPKRNTNAFAESRGMKFIDLTDPTVPAAVLDLVPELIARKEVVMPLSFENGVLRIAMSDPSDFDTIEQLQFFLNMEFQPVLASRERIIEAINRHYVQWETESVGAEFADAIGRTVAIHDFTEAIRLDPKDAGNYFWRARCHEQPRELDQAIADYTEAIRLDPKGTVAFVERGYCHEQKGEHDRAIADFTEAIRLNPDVTAEHGGLSPHCERGKCYEQIGEHDKAIADFEEALLLYTLPFHGEGAALLAHLNEAIRRHPNVADHYYWRGRFYQMYPMDDHESSDIEFELNLEFEPSLDDEATPNPEPSKAQADFTKAIELDPTVADYYLWRAASTGEGNEAIADLTEAIRLDPNKDEAFFNRGHSYCQTGELDKAIADYTEVLRLLASPNAPYCGILTKEDLMREAYYYRGLAYHPRGDRDKDRTDDMQDIDESDFELSLDTKPAPAWGWPKHRGESDHDKGRADELRADELLWKQRLGTFGQFNPTRICTGE